MEEMKKLGLTDVAQDEYGNVFGIIPSTICRLRGKSFSMIAHMDAALACFRKEYQTKSY